MNEEADHSMNNLSSTPWGTLTKRLFLDRHLDFWLREVDPTLSVREFRARIVDIIVETRDTRTFVLRPSRRWKGFAAGQYVTLEVEIEGVRRRRCYSISSAPDAGPSFTITVKRVEGGSVSAWLHDRARIGEVVTIGPAAGGFVLPRPAPAKLLFVSGGSGITPIFSLLTDLAAQGGLRNAVLLHYAPTREDVIFHDRLVALAERHPGLRLLLRFTRGKNADARFGEEGLRGLVPDFVERHTFLCGPPALMEEVERVWARRGLADRLQRERFVPPAARTVVEGAAGARVTLLKSERSFESDGRGTLLEQAERAGAKPAFGCRQGICHTCKCRKRSGAVQNLLTGEISSEPDEDIQLCISVVRSDVELSL
jgi:ferredoxin-NADP reductase